MSQGKLITFEGIDGAGKTTLSKKIIEKLQRNPIPHWTTNECFLTEEPTKNSPYYPKIKEILKNHNIIVDDQDLLELYIKDRILHSEKIKKELIKKNVISSRYDLSTYAYQSLKDNSRKNLEMIYQKHSYSEKKTLIPEITFFLDLKVELAIKRIQERNKKFEYFEKIDFLKKIKKNYFLTINLLEKKDKRKIKIIRTDGNLEEAIDIVYKTLKTLS